MKEIDELVVNYNVPRIWTVDEIEAEYSKFEGTIESKPETERKLFALQEKYLTTRDRKYWNEMFNVIVPYAGSILKGYLESLREHMEEDEIEHCAITATYLFLRQYLKKNDQCVGTSFAGILIFKVKEARKEFLSLSIASSQLGKNKDNPFEDGDCWDIIEAREKLGLKNIGNTYISVEEEFINKNEHFFDEIFDQFDAVKEVPSYTRAVAYMYLYLNLRKPRCNASIPMFEKRFFKDIHTKNICELLYLEVFTKYRSGIMLVEGKTRKKKNEEEASA